VIDVGTRSAYAATHFAAPIMVEQKSGLIVNISSVGAVRFFHHAVYGVGKAALDRITKETAHPLKRHGVAVVSLWPHIVMTERVERIPDGFLDKEGAESLRFTGRAVVALATDSNVLERTGRAFGSRSLADDYGFTDVDGTLPKAPPWNPPR